MDVQCYMSLYPFIVPVTIWGGERIGITLKVDTVHAEMKVSSAVNQRDSDL